MRAFVCLLLIGCGNDTFTSDEGGSDGSTDGIVSSDASDTGADVRTDGPPTCAWCPQAFPNTNNLFGVWGSNAANAVAVVGTQTAYWWSSGWAPITGASTYNLKAVRVLGPAVWAAGNDGLNMPNSALLLTGSSSQIGIPTPSIASRPTTYNAVMHCALFGGVTGAVYGSQTIAFQVAVNGPWLFADGTTNYFGMDCEGVANAVAVGTGKVATFNGMAWTETTYSGAHNAVSGNGVQGWIAGANGEIVHYTNSNSFQIVPSGTNEDLRGIHVRALGDVYAVGRNGTIVYIKAGAMNGVLQPSGTNEDLNAIWGDANGMWAVGDKGTVLRHP